jgi:phage-related tail protein
VSKSTIWIIGAGAVAAAGLLYVMKSSQAASEAAARAAASRAAAEARAVSAARGSDDALGNLLTELGGRAISAAVPYLFGGTKDANAATAKAAAVSV